MRERLDKITRTLSRQVENVVLLDVVDSTHAMARRLMTDMDEEEQSLGPTVIVADRQESGEGRLGRQWASPSGGLYMNWMRSSVDTETITRLPMLAAAAVVAAVRAVGIEDPGIKWPNDILVAGRKLAGLLVFARHGTTNWVTVGVGVNVESTPVLDEGQALQATSIAELLKNKDPEACRNSLIGEFVGSLTRSLTDPAPALAAWRRHLLQRPGDTVRLRITSGKEVTGTLIAVSEEGFLRVGVDGEEQVITGGDLIEL